MTGPIRIPALSLVVLVGPSGSGKSTFARRWFRPTEVVSSDVCRALVADDEGDQSASADAFEVLGVVARKRLARGKLTVIDATSVREEDRAPLVALAREQHVLPVAIVFDLPERVCLERNRARPDRDFGPHVVRQQRQALRRGLRGLSRQGFRHVTVFTSEAEVEAATLERQPLWCDRRDDHGPFDIVGDVHGCYDELVELLGRLGYAVEGEREAPRVRAPEGRRAVFLGDLVDRGPASAAVLRLVRAMVASGVALAVPGNHDVKLLRKLRGRDVRLTHGLAATIAELDAEPPGFRDEVARFIDGLVSHYVLDGGKLVVAHAGLREELQGRASSRVRDFALYGETTGETDDMGLPVRYPWANDYRGQAMVVYGHTPVPEAEWVNRTICIDTGCAFGGRLTALRYPERELVAVEARRTYYEPARPLRPPGEATPPPPGAPAEAREADLLDIGDVLGKRAIALRSGRTITVREPNAVAALEAMSRFAIDPRWLIYLPPTMSPPDTCKEGAVLEHPGEAFAYFRHEGIAEVLCEEKHMGSRAVIVLCRDEAVAARRFGGARGARGVIYTRTGRPFFAAAGHAPAVLARLGAAVEQAGLWEALATDWIALDAEVLPWSAKAEELLRGQYAPVGAAAAAGLGAAVEALRAASARGSSGGSGGSAPLLERFEERRATVAGYIDAYRRYCWTVERIDDLRVAPFHVLASEGAVHLGRDHGWHMETLAELCRADEGLLRPTAHLRVDVTDPASEARATAWWEERTAAGAEGMVVKPLAGEVRGRRGPVQPAVKCRGREYLRIIYGPEYTLPEHLARLRQRGLSAKRSLAIREHALGVEALHRFVDREPLYRVHECVFAVLALESEPVDPRL